MLRRQAVASCVAGLLAAPGVAQAKDPPRKEPLRASVDVDAGALGEDADVVENRVQIRVGSQLRKAEVLPRKSLSDGVIHIDVTLLPGGAGYHYEVYAEQNDKTLDASVTSEDCVSCSEDALLDAVSAAVDACLPPLADATATSVEPTPEPTVTVTPTTDEPTDTPRIGPMGKTGIALMVAGAASAVVGVIFVVQGRSFSSRPGSVQQEGLDFRPPGFGLIGGGAAALITGGVLYGVDRKRRKTASLGWIPGGVALTVGGRF
ncbi:MAG: hypothetical protein AAGA54_30600 [Myxococcota bacterium]